MVPLQKQSATHRWRAATFWSLSQPWNRVVGFYPHLALFHFHLSSLYEGFCKACGCLRPLICPYGARILTCRPGKFFFCWREFPILSIGFGTRPLIDLSCHPQSSFRIVGSWGACVHSLLRERGCVTHSSVLTISYEVGRLSYFY
jgi:hypothetical protein